VADYVADIAGPRCNIVRFLTISWPGRGIVPYPLKNVRVNLCTRHSTGSDSTIVET